MTDKVYRSITSWADFEKAWEANETEAGAIGLLHAGAKIGWVDGHRTGDQGITAELRKCAAKKVDFYLDVATRNDILGVTAAQLIVRVLLQEELVTRWVLRTGQSYLQLLAFLATVRDCLRKPPYPSMVTDFLHSSYHNWYGVRGWKLNEREIEHYKNVSPEYGQTRPLFRAILAWGYLGCILAPSFGRATPDFKTIFSVMDEPIKAFLVETSQILEWNEEVLGWGLGRALMKLKPPTDLYKEDGKNEVWKQTVLAYLYLKFQKS